MLYLHSLEEAEDVFKALNTPTRIRIMELIHKWKMSMNELCYPNITFAVLLTEISASAFGNGIQGGSGVSAVINSYSTCSVPPSII